MRIENLLQQQAQADQLRARPAQQAFNAPRYAPGSQSQPRYAGGWMPKYVTDKPPEPRKQTGQAIQTFMNQGITNRFDPNMSLMFPALRGR